MSHLTGRQVLAIVTNYGVEQDELIVPLRHLRDHGAVVTLAAVSGEDVRTLVGDEKPGETVAPDTTVAEVDPAGFDLLLVPGGTINADTLRLQRDAVDVVEAFASSGRPVAAICHGPWLLVEAGKVSGARLTSYPSLATDVRNAGGTWVDEPVVRDTGAGFPLVTSRNPDDLPDFLREIEAVLEAHRPGS
ncbi:type 1 glutamine amidotransferase domain-containing protein [Promicromonospora thailandica]|uniref:Protease I n=1 Tax=Promicromonospora thailandica TaxID=765201 RepID=A0A9X2JV61_9MICO|nr:type 1 glutamine amidotransferase domain-containing protein [Promicromonospora thailandica]MCP2264197.1 protease I [Promicromonospora thailandica]BFF21134.1 type 1 glutamine amidotransferase domain-containing protein [Promicromonospora thailandica]